MPYTPDPLDITQPTTDKFLESAAAEFRALKVRVAEVAASSGGGSGLTTLANYLSLRLYTGAATTLLITDSQLTGTFYHDAADTSSADNGGTVIVDSTARRWKRLYSGPVKASWFGATTGADSAAAISAALAASDAVLLEAFYPIATGIVLSTGRSYSLLGIGEAISGLLYTGSTGGTVITYTKTYSDKHVLTLSNLGIRSNVSGNTAIRIQAALTAASVQVNGQMDAAIIDNVNISSESASYWTTGLHIINAGGVHANKLKIENRDSAQPLSGVRGIYIQQTDSRVALIRTLTATDLYIVRTNVGIETSTLGTSGNGIESIYVTAAEIIAHYGMVCGGVISAVRFSGVHMDVIHSAIDCAAATTTVMRLVGCDFRKSNNGGSYTAGPLLRWDYAEGINVSSSFLSGVEEMSSSTSNLAVQFSSTINGSGMQRSAFIGNVFRAHYYVFGVTPNVNDVAAAGNSYGSITGAINQNTDEDVSISKADSSIVDSFVTTIDASADQVVYRTTPNTVKLFTGAPLTVVPTIASAHSNTLTITYDYGLSSNTQLAFRVKGNSGGSQSIRISYIAQGAAAM